MCRITAALACVALVVIANSAEPRPVSTDTSRDWASTSSFAAPEAHQAAAADGEFVYAIANAVVARYDRLTGERVAVSTGEATHLNSGFLWEGKLLCAHSNYPTTPELSEIKSLDLESMRLSTLKDFGNFGGSSLGRVRPRR